MPPRARTERTGYVRDTAAYLVCVLLSQSLFAAEDVQTMRLIRIVGSVLVSPAGANQWASAVINQPIFPGLEIKTGELSHAEILMKDGSVFKMDELTHVTIPATGQAKTRVNLWRGLLYFFNRDKPGATEVEGPQVAALVLGTEFLFDVSSNGIATLTLLDGSVVMTNQFGTQPLKTGEAGSAPPGSKPVLTAAGLNTTDAKWIQWCLYYPAILDLADLPFGPEDRAALGASLEAYQSGDAGGAFAAYPERSPNSSAAAVFHAALLVSAGHVAKAEAELEKVPRKSQLAPTVAAIKTLIAAVQFRADMPERGRLDGPLTASECMAFSYAAQSHGDLKLARTFAGKAVAQSPHFGFAWARMAELEFSFGQTAHAQASVERALELAPLNAQAFTLKGYLASAENHVRRGLEFFERAIFLDAGLGNAWLGRGLCRIRLGDLQGGRRDIQVAAAMEPQRAVLRSYLGKAFDRLRETARARRELELAKRLDLKDPTARLYSALLEYEQNRFNRAVRELEESQRLNNNRSLFRAKMLLDQDRAVRSANLAAIYQKSGMEEVSVREAAQAVTSDYANHSAHLFLAESYNALRDPTRFNLRYETAWFNELLLADLLAPVGAGTLSQQITSQEFSRLFEADRLGLSTDTEYRSDGQVQELGSQFGTFGNTSYALDLDYQHNDGIRPNNELSRIEWYSRFKEQLTAQDSVFLLTKYQDYHSGDNFQYYDPSQVRPHYQLDELQRPILMAGYHREWSPGVHTLLLAGRLPNDQHVRDQEVPIGVFVRDGGTLREIHAGEFDVDYHSEFLIYGGELNQILQTEHNTTVSGVRYQSGEFITRDRLLNVSDSLLFPNPALDQRESTDFQRGSVYAYHTWQAPISSDLFLTAGLAYDSMKYPENHRVPPISEVTATRHQLSPKAALVWSPDPAVAVRTVYTRSLGGVSYDESFRLEPAQLAGFSQAFRTIIPESVAGSVSAPRFETAGAALDIKTSSHTYAGLQGEFLWSDVDDSVGVFDWTLGQPIAPSTLRRELRYEERSLLATINHLVSEEWSFGAAYRFARSELDTVFPTVPLAIDSSARSIHAADLHQFSLYGLFNHRSGFFSKIESKWYLQSSSGYSPGSPELAGAGFSQVNFYAGFRSRRQRGEINVGLLNIGGGDYHLNSLNPYSELPRKRTVAVRLRYCF